MPRKQTKRTALPTRRGTALLLTTLVALALVAPRNGSAAEEGQKTELHKRMKQMDDDMKKLRRTLRNKEGNAESLELMTRIEEAAVVCKAMTPAQAAKVPEGERPKFLAGYRKDMAALVGVMCQMESAVLDGDNDKAQELYKNLKEREDAGHDKYLPEDQKDKAK